ncbi:MAG: hypothetical protein OXG15_07370 [Gammaproteobacteria bacterium]|nr:hypothetical protein [Gammaproteobacteria bacterium]
MKIITLTDLQYADLMGIVNNYRTKVLPGMCIDADVKEVANQAVEDLLEALTKPEIQDEDFVPLFIANDLCSGGLN